MKNTFKVLGIIGFMLVIGFSFVACGDDNGGGGSGGGTVTYPDGMADKDKPTNFFIHSLTATINNGKVDIVFGEPVRATNTVGDFFNSETGYKVTANPSDTKFIQSTAFHSNDYKYYMACLKGDNGYAYFMYADRDATIKGTYDHNYVDANRNRVHAITIVDASLKKGWNCWVVTRTGTLTERTYTETASSNIPSGFKWTVFDPLGWATWMGSYW